MADDTVPNPEAPNPQTNTGPGSGNGAETGPAIGMVSQYVKDFSFENPNAPASYRWAESPQVDIQFNIGANKLGDDMHEVVLRIEVSGKAEQGTQFVVDLSYAGLFGARNVTDEQIHPFLYAEAPRILFPFVRRILADAVRDGGFPPLLLEPIDFSAVYSQQLAAKQQQDAAGATSDQPAGSA